MNADVKIATANSWLAMFGKDLGGGVFQEYGRLPVATWILQQSPPKQEQRANLLIPQGAQQAEQGAGTFQMFGMVPYQCHVVPATTLPNFFCYCPAQMKPEFMQEYLNAVMGAAILSPDERKGPDGKPMN